eukprot:765763-Hanusia_phi.AAC.2
MGNAARSLGVQYDATSITGWWKIAWWEAMKKFIRCAGKEDRIGGAGMNVGRLHQRILKSPLRILGLTKQGVQRELTRRIPLVLGVQVNDVGRVGSQESSLSIRQVGLALQMGWKGLHQPRGNSPLLWNEGRSSINTEQARQGDCISFLRTFQVSRIGVMRNSTINELLRSSQEHLDQLGGGGLARDHDPVTKAACLPGVDLITFPHPRERSGPLEELCCSDVVS